MESLIKFKTSNFLKVIITFMIFMSQWNYLKLKKGNRIVSVEQKRFWRSYYHDF